MTLHYILFALKSQSIANLLFRPCSAFYTLTTNTYIIHCKKKNVLMVSVIKIKHRFLDFYVTLSVSLPCLLVFPVRSVEAAEHFSGAQWIIGYVEDICESHEARCDERFRWDQRLEEWRTGSCPRYWNVVGLRGAVRYTEMPRLKWYCTSATESGEQTYQPALS